MLGSDRSRRGCDAGCLRRVDEGRGAIRSRSRVTVDLSIWHRAESGAAAIQTQPGADRSQHRRNCRSGRGAHSRLRATRQRRSRARRPRAGCGKRFCGCRCTTGRSSCSASSTAFRMKMRRRSSGCPVGTMRSRLSRARQMLIERCKALLEARQGRREARAKAAEPGEGRTRGEEMADTHEEQLLSELLSGIARDDERLEAAHLESRIMATLDTSPARLVQAEAPRTSSSPRRL